MYINIQSLIRVDCLDRAGGECLVDVAVAGVVVEREYVTLRALEGVACQLTLSHVVGVQYDSV